MEKLRKILLFILVLFLLFSLSKNLFDYQKTVSFYEGYKNEYEKEKKTNIELKTAILRNNDPNELEKTIRNKLNLLKPNEIAVIVPKPTEPPKREKPQPLPIYLQWFNVLLGR